MKPQQSSPCSQFRVLQMSLQRLKLLTLVRDLAIRFHKTVRHHVGLLRLIGIMGPKDIFSSQAWDLDQHE
ncbi:hypothetical protein CEXT_180381 [Caerostris extrusa]|uniref:Uncharacterized protein n=1 Tax=Caerostris extrusa TaxID=172846 RepID=A0AAV4NQH3_CAEEX|nr:hypothetical protein CEXT_180381 [Caerostris extrusa]